MGISTKPGSPGRAVLDALSGGAATAEDLARRALPWEPRPYRTPAERLAERARKREHEHAIRAKAARVSHLLGRLAEAGLVEPAHGVQLDPIVSRAWEREGEAALRERRYRYARRAGELLIVGVEVVRPPERAVALVRALVERGPLSLRDLAAASGGLTPAGDNISGTWKRLYRQLCEECVLLPPQARRLTEAGRLLTEPRAQARVDMASIGGHPLSEQAFAVLEDVRRAIMAESAAASLPPLIVRPVEDGSVAIELRGPLWRLLISVEPDSSDSGWSVVSAAPQHPPVMGGLDSVKEAIQRSIQLAMSDLTRDQTE